MTQTELISVIVPMFNEAAHVESLVDDLAYQDFTRGIEVLVADGGSTDDSRELLARAARRAQLDLTILENPRRIVSTGLNACIERARGQLIVRLDCHSRYPADYLSKCARAADETGAWNVGGVYEPAGETPTERAVGCALATAFGGVNWTRDAKQGQRVEADTVYLGAFRPIAFEKAGVYSADLLRNQDDELNLRIRRAGGRIVLDPSIRAFYVPRSTHRALARQYYEYGYWKAIVMAMHGQALSGRSLAPPAFVVWLAGLSAASAASRSARRALGFTLATYSAVAVGFGLVSLRERRSSLALLPRVVATYPVLHLSYGLGLVAAASRLMLHGRSRLRADDDAT